MLVHPLLGTPIPQSGFLVGSYVPIHQSADYAQIKTF